MSMHGVVIWYSRQDFRAIVWCEDSKELGIASGPTAWRNPMVAVEVGDIVGFRAEMRGSDRLCRDLHVVETQVAPSLPATVLAKAQTPPVSRIPLLHLCSSRD
ncbi:MAG: hypothetical protein U0934_10510 [Pseudotabrizicola sp.]|uniref:hypothetical protein n=1 Tax=Pseudotabrizicola sp. TaxID=2939647 RepID=UPI002716ABB4|nr:hypothetical protein [Pseudotabrizicola sp.]MDO8882258.1 hypothetical protein [Pseudotabrizicola sp.]MDP2082841.1 hypothetical protein [Pseudotabrizicola sp.]MDZ7574374.1 hypothetical protein [Pseudotabrizicola sp.]